MYVRTWCAYTDSHAVYTCVQTCLRVLHVHVCVCALIPMSMPCPYVCMHVVGACIIACTHALNIGVRMHYTAIHTRTCVCVFVY